MESGITHFIVDFLRSGFSGKLCALYVDLSDGDFESGKMRPTSGRHGLETTLVWQLKRQRLV